MTIQDRDAPSPPTATAGSNDSDRAVELERDADVAIVTLARPHAANSVDRTLASDFRAAVAECDADRSIRAVLIRAKGRVFCAGGDIATFVDAGLEVAALTRDLTDDLHAALVQLRSLGKPVVTAIQGAAAGAGIGLALAGDIVVAGRAASFSIAYPAIGLTPDAGASWILPRLVGVRRALEIALLNPRLSAEMALAYGLVTRVVEDDALPEISLDLTRRLAGGPTSALAATRRMILEGLERSYVEQLGIEARAIATSASGEEGREGIAAFVARRPPDFRRVV